MTERTREEWLVIALRELVDAEASQRSAMKIYKDHPHHGTRVRAEARMYHAIAIAKSVLSDCHGIGTDGERPQAGRLEKGESK